MQILEYLKRETSFSYLVFFFSLVYIGDDANTWYHLYLLRTELSTANGFWKNIRNYCSACTIQATVEPRYNEPLHNEILGIMNNILQLGLLKLMHGTVPRYNEPSITNLYLINEVLGIDGLHVTSWRPCWWTGTIRFFSSGSLFLCKLCEQIFFCFVHQHGGNANH